MDDTTTAEQTEALVVTRRDLADLDAAERWRYEQLRTLGFEKDHAWNLALLKDNERRYVADLNFVRRCRRQGTEAATIYDLLV